MDDLSENLKHKISTMVKCLSPIYLIFPQLLDRDIIKEINRFEIIHI